jgi:hypothetical protein
MEPHGSLLFLQKSTIGPCSEPDESNPYHPMPFSNTKHESLIIMWNGRQYTCPLKLLLISRVCVRTQCEELEGQEGGGGAVAEFPQL